MKMIEQVIKNIVSPDEKIKALAQDRLDSLTKPLGSLGRLEELVKQIAGIKASLDLELKNKVIFTLAADHGVTAEGVSPYPKEVTAQMVYNFLNGGAGINVLSRHAGARVVVADLGVAADLKPGKDLIIKKINYGTKNMALGPAMLREEAVKSIEAGIEIFQQEYNKGIDIIGIGEMGIGNTTASSAITAIITGKPLKEITGRGAGLDDQGLAKKIRIIERAIKINQPNAQDAIDILTKVGGFEIGGLIGIILAAAAQKTPVVIDGFISGAASLIACRIEPKVKNYLIASHCSVEKGHRVILEYLQLAPLFDLNLRLGEGTGAALGINLCDAAIKIFSQMATFKSAGVSEKI
ncbi:MAG: nicotinate-nucleotide--dimethylbenzimidazole phosphoribosyltransferase [Candidatus Omnitrophica bacterium]|nr:nicotinate-nucleotide--dimethylbenzimidazole phosphoribosyltransferase [Candidatus Omnitrophota bacterium]